MIHVSSEFIESFSKKIYSEVHAHFLQQAKEHPGTFQDSYLADFDQPDKEILFNRIKKEIQFQGLSEITWISWSDVTNILHRLEDTSEFDRITYLAWKSGVLKGIEEGLALSPNERM